MGTPLNRSQVDPAGSSAKKEPVPDRDSLIYQ
jgi:hypothetical protein